MMKTLDIECVGYSVKADVYEGSDKGPILLSLIGLTSRRNKEHYTGFLSRLGSELGITTVIFDYTGHGDSPFDVDDLYPAQHFLEVVTVFDWIVKNYPGRKIFVVGSSYGGYMATQLTKYREFEGLILRAPAIYLPVDFYTSYGKRDYEITMAFRKNTAALANHPLLGRAAEFRGKVLLVVHENDEVIPKETTDAYANAFKPEIILAKEITHSLSDATPQQAEDYNQAVFDWLEQTIS